MKNVKKILFDLGIWLMIFAAIGWNVQKAINNNTIKEKVARVQQDVTDLELRTRKLELLSTYYKSTTYQELEARRRLSLKQEGETAYFVKGVMAELNNALDVNDSKAEEVEVADKTNFTRWLDYIKGR